MHSSKDDDPFMKTTLDEVERNKISSGELVAGQFPKYWKGLMLLAQNSGMKYKKW